VLGTAAVASACGSSLPPVTQTTSNLPNIGQIERAIAQTILNFDHVTAQVVCPSMVPEIAGEQFSCIGVARHPTVRTFMFLVTERSGSYVTYEQVK
jgi:hypothetical protein